MWQLIDMLSTLEARHDAKGHRYDSPRKEIPILQKTNAVFSQTNSKEKPALSMRSLRIEKVPHPNR
jgi:hypothetical protein